MFPSLKKSSVKDFRLNDSRIVAVAVHAFIRRISVDHDGLVADHLGLNVALGARNVGMSSRQRQMRFRIVIERRRNPALRRVAVPAMGLGVLGHELPIVGVIVARLALLWNALET